MSFYVEYEGDGLVYGRFHVPGATGEEALEHARKALIGVAVRTAALRFTLSPVQLHRDGRIVAHYSPSTGWEMQAQFL